MSLKEVKQEVSLVVAPPEATSKFIEMKDYLIKLKHGERGLYTGQLLKSSLIPNGKGACTFDQGRKYEGRFRDGEYHGQGTYYWAKDHKYVGEWVNHKMSGKGVLYYPDGSVYTGGWVDGVREGTGEMTRIDGYKYVGAFKNDMKHGYGVEDFPGGVKIKRYEGQFSKNERNGKGIL